MIIKVDLSFQGAASQYEALKALLQTGTVESMEIDSIGMGGPIGDRLKHEGYKQVSVKEHYRGTNR